MALFFGHNMSALVITPLTQLPTINYFDSLTETSPDKLVLKSAILLYQLRHVCLMAVLYYMQGGHIDIRVYVCIYGLMW